MKFIAAFGLIAALSLAACADRQSGSVAPQEVPRGNQPGGQAGGQPAQAGPEIRWRTALVGDVVTVDVMDRNNAYRVERVELLSPDGRSYSATDITRERMSPGGRWSDSSSGVGVGVGGSGGSRGGSNVGVMFDFPLGGGGRADPIGSESRSSARIPLANPGAYRANAAQWQVRVSLSDLAGYNSVATFPAPLPGN